MTSSFSEGVRRRSGVACARAAVPLLLAAALGAGCREEPVDVTEATFFRPNGNDRGDPPACQTFDGQPLGQVETYVVQVYEIEDRSQVAASPSRLDCQHCLQNPSWCHPQAPSCVCGPKAWATPDVLPEALMGTRIQGLDGDYLYCVRVLALSAGRLSSGDSPTSCACQPDWTDPSFQESNTRICALSAPRNTGPLGFQLEVRCPSDSNFRGCLASPTTSTTN